MSNKNTILTDFKYFSYYLQLNLFVIKNIDIKNIYIRDVYTKNTYARSTNAIKYLKIY